MTCNSLVGWGTWKYSKLCLQRVQYTSSKHVLCCCSLEVSEFKRFSEITRWCTAIKIHKHRLFSCIVKCFLECHTNVHPVSKLHLKVMEYLIQCCSEFWNNFQLCLDIFCSCCVMCMCILKYWVLPFSLIYGILFNYPLHRLLGASVLTVGVFILWEWWNRGNFKESIPEGELICRKVAPKLSVSFKPVFILQLISATSVKSLTSSQTIPTVPYWANFVPFIFRVGS